MKWCSSDVRAARAGSRSTRAKWPPQSARFPGRLSVASARGLKDNTTEPRAQSQEPKAKSHEAAESRLRLSGVWRSIAQVDGTLQRVRRVELARRGARRRCGSRRRQQPLRAVLDNIVCQVVRRG